MPVQDRKSGGNSAIYLKYIELIILKYLSTKYDTEEVLFSRRKLWLSLGMINNNYRKVENEKILKCYPDVITVDEINSFYIRVNSRLNKILKTALDNLAKRKLINYEERTIICKQVNGCYSHKQADTAEREKITNLEYKILHELGCETISDVVINSKRSSIYYSKIDNIIKSKYNWEYYYKAYSIVFNHDNIRKTIPRVEESLDDAIHHLNQNIIEALNREAEKIYEKKVAEYNAIFDEIICNPAAIRKLTYIEPPNKNYLIAQKILTNELVNVSYGEPKPAEPIDILRICRDFNCTIEDINELNNLFANNIIEIAI